METTRSLSAENQFTINFVHGGKWTFDTKESKDLDRIVAEFQTQSFAVVRNLPRTKGGRVRFEYWLQHGRPAIFHSDQGVQYAAWEHTQLLHNAGVQISMSDTGQPTQNGLVERFLRTFKEEHVDCTDYPDYDDAFGQIGRWLEVEYMTERIHSSLSYLTPAKFEAAAIAANQSPLAFGVFVSK